MTLYRAFLWLWIGGLVLLAIVVVSSLPLVLTEAPGGILDHQAAGSAAEIDRIQRAWAEAGLLEQARIAMIADLVFIGAYGTGSVLGGVYFRRIGTGILRGLATTIVLAGAVFLVTDYVETIAQFIQLSRFEGGDRLAGLAAEVRPLKIACWLITFFGMVLAFILRGKSGQALD